MVVCRELTKRYEEGKQGDLESMIAFYETEEPKGEFVLVIEGKSFSEIEQEARAQWEEMSIEAHLSHYMEQGIDKKEAMKKVAKDRGISKREVYAAVVKD
jgi:16S rRNA (cytidine1402-2'-O)-methyltransferase